jgi:putative heme-binding domain-containing protein
MLLILVLMAMPGLAEERNPFGTDPAAIEAGKETFLGACSACHGASGDGGQGPSLVSGRQINRLSDEQLLRSIRDGLRGTAMPPFPMPQDKLWQLVSFVRSLSAPAYTARLAGNAASGAALFSGKGQCSGCHMIGGEGGALGPDLTNVGATRTVHQLRRALLEPSARIEPGFVPVVAVTAAGARIEGVAKNHNSYSLQILDRSGRLHLLRRAHLKSVELGEKSPMPDGAGQRFSPAEIEDLLAYLSRKTARPEQGAGK